jgi:hypothetical protein
VLRANDTVEIFGQLEATQGESSYRESGQNKLRALVICVGDKATKTLDDWLNTQQKEQRAKLFVEEKERLAQLRAKQREAQPPSIARSLFVRWAWLPLVLAMSALYLEPTNFLLFSAVVTFLVALGAEAGATGLPSFYHWQQPMKLATQEARGTSIIPVPIALRWSVLVVGLVWAITEEDSYATHQRLSSVIPNMYPPKALLKEELDGALCVATAMIAWLWLGSVSLYLSARARCRYVNLLLEAPLSHLQPDGRWSSTMGKLRNRVGDPIESFTLETSFGDVDVQMQDAIHASEDAPRPMVEGDEMLVVGRLENNRLAATGPQSLILFRATKNPLLTIQKMMHEHNLAIYQLLLFAVVLMASTVYALRAVY